MSVNAVARDLRAAGCRRKGREVQLMRKKEVRFCRCPALLLKLLQSSLLATQIPEPPLPTLTVNASSRQQDEATPALLPSSLA